MVEKAVISDDEDDVGVGEDGRDEESDGKGLTKATMMRTKMMALTVKTKDQLQQQQHRQLNSEQQWLQHLQLQLFLQQQGQHLQLQHHGDEARLQHGSIRNHLAKQSTATQKMYKEDLNLRSQDVLSEAEIEKFMQSKYGENAHLANATRASLLRSAVGVDQPPELLKLNPPVGNSKYGMGDE